MLSLCLIKEPVGNKLERCSVLESGRPCSGTGENEAALDSPLDLD